MAAMKDRRGEKTEVTLTRVVLYYGCEEKWLFLHSLLYREYIEN